ncbi:hypothetical protein CDL15_Pgr013314 [Punica granatum]|uniref:Uncharacterized protein n=1 Tax=Punica granatum TaxID=22663 RepID=A0A218WPX2_PUNGR|nr:hypothetical protein CDL15_Pgr013314 [Punica granatum]
MAAAAAPSKGNIVFALDDIPYFRWPNKLQEFLAYLTTRLLTNDNNHDVMSELYPGLRRHYKNWWTSLNISLKQAFLSSILASLAEAVERSLQTRRKRVIDCTVGEIQQEIHIALEDVCKKKEVIIEVLKGDRTMEKACRRLELYIKCSGRDKTCNCSTKKKKHYKKWKMSMAKSRRYSGKK